MVKYVLMSSIVTEVSGVSSLEGIYADEIVDDPGIGSAGFAN